MDSSEVTKLIDAEIAGDFSRTNAHGVDLHRCLVTPTRETFAGHPGSDPWDLWLVLEERPETRDGYKIVYDDEVKQFGLATANRVFIGFYGTFIQTLEGM
jgi:hypothetical protein